MISIEEKEETKEILIKLCHIRENFLDGIEDALYQIGDRIVTDEIRLEKSRTQTGRIYGGIRASAEGEVPSYRTGRLASGTSYAISGPLRMEIGQTAPYAPMLHDRMNRMNLQKPIEDNTGNMDTIFKQSINKKIL